jgi:hypothetical protein
MKRGNRAASHEVSSLGGRNPHTYFEVLLARLTYEKGERRPQGFRGDSRDSIHKLIHPRRAARGHDAHARQVSQSPILTIIALDKTEP